MSSLVEDRILKLIVFMTSMVVDNTQEVLVEVFTLDNCATYMVHVASSDLGQAIGKKGRIANAIRVIAKSSAMKDGQKIFVEIAPKIAL